MAVRVTNETYQFGDGTYETERYVSGDRVSVAVYDHGVVLDAWGLPDLPLAYADLVDLREVVNAAVDLIYPTKVSGAA